MPLTGEPLALVASPVVRVRLVVRVPLPRAASLGIVIRCGVDREAGSVLVKRVCSFPFASFSDTFRETGPVRSDAGTSGPPTPSTSFRSAFGTASPWRRVVCPKFFQAIDNGELR